MEDIIDSELDAHAYLELTEYDALRQGHSIDQSYFRNPTLDTSESLCNDCQRFLQRDWYEKSIIHDNLEILSESARHCHLCLVIFDAITEKAAVMYDGPLEGFMDSIVWGMLKPIVSRHLAHPNESIQTGEPSDEIEESDPSAVERSVNFQAAILEGDEMGNLFDRGMEGARQVFQRYPKDSLGRDFYSSKDVSLVAIEVGLHRAPSITNPIPSSFSRSKRVYDGTTREAKVSAKIQITSFEDEVCDFLQCRDDPTRLYNDHFTGSSQRMALCACWLKQCLDCHEHCPKLNHRSPLPRRVIDVGSSQALNHPFLHESQGQVGTYVALSHHWGKTQMLETHLRSIDIHRQRLPMATLPETFQHAIQVVRSLGFQYLWIDSLCIVQDSLQDWSFESIQMAQIYQNAAITLAATDTDDSDSGLFVPLPGRYKAPCFLGKLFYGLGSSDDRRTVQLYARKEAMRRRGDEVSARPRGPLDTRAWVLQEEILSPRLLSFTNDGIFWECQHSDASESHPEGCYLYDTRYEDRFIPEVKYARSFRRMINPAADAVQERWAHVSPMRAWQSLVADYTSRDLSRDSDTVVAIKGVADAISHLTQGEYLLGLWRERLHEQLLWYVDMGHPDYISHTVGGIFQTFSGYKTPPLLRPPHRRSELQAPSWTWVTSKHPIKWAAFGSAGKESMVNVVSIDVTCEAHNNYQGRLELEGTLAGTFAVPRQTNKWEELVDPINQCNRSKWLYCDDVTWQDPRMVCLAIARWQSIAYCVVLYPCNEAIGDAFGFQYRRIGYAEWKEDAWVWLTTGVRPLNDRSESLARSSSSSSSSIMAAPKTKTPMIRRLRKRIVLQKQLLNERLKRGYIDWTDVRFCVSSNHGGVTRRITVI